MVGPCVHQALTWAPAPRYLHYMELQYRQQICQKLSLHTLYKDDLLLGPLVMYMHLYRGPLDCLRKILE